MRPDPAETADLVKFTEKILNGKLHFLWSAKYSKYSKFQNSFYNFEKMKL